MSERLAKFDDLIKRTEEIIESKRLELDDWVARLEQLKEGRRKAAKKESS